MTTLGIILAFAGCKSHKASTGFVEFTANQQRLHWDNAHIQIYWEPSNFQWLSLGIPSNLRWDHYPNEQKMPLHLLGILFFGSPNGIIVVNDLVGKSFTSTNFIFALPGHFSRATALLSSLYQSRPHVTYEPLQITIDAIDPIRRRMIGRFHGYASFQKAGQPENTQVVVSIADGEFNVPIIPFLQSRSEVDLPWTHEQSDHLKRIYSPSHYVAFDTIQKEARLRNPDAEFQMGYMYHFGQGVIENEAEAIEWWTKAAEGGSISAMEILATVSAHDALNNYFWFEILDLNQAGHKWKKAQEQMAAYLTNDQLKDAQLRAKNWCKLHPRPLIQRLHVIEERSAIET